MNNLTLNDDLEGGCIGGEVEYGVVDYSVCEPNFRENDRGFKNFENKLYYTGLIDKLTGEQNVCIQVYPNSIIKPVLGRTSIEDTDGITFIDNKNNFVRYSHGTFAEMKLLFSKFTLNDLSFLEQVLPIIKK